MKPLWLMQAVFAVLTLGIILCVYAWETTTTTTVPSVAGICASPCPPIPDCRLVVPRDRCRVLWTRQDRPGWVRQLRKCPA